MEECGIFAGRHWVLDVDRIADACISLAEIKAVIGQPSLVTPRPRRSLASWVTAVPSRCSAAFFFLSQPLERLCIVLRPKKLSQCTREDTVVIRGMREKGHG